MDYNENVMQKEAEVEDVSVFPEQDTFNEDDMSVIFDEEVNSDVSNEDN